MARAECREFAQDPLGPIDDIIATLNRDEGARRTYATASEHLTSILDSFEAHADRRLTIAIVEDIHWADVTLVRALAVLAARAARHRLLVIATARDNEIAPSHPNFIAFGKLLREPSVSRIALAPLGRSDIRALLDTALAGRIDLPSLVLEDVGRRSEGNPLFAEELLRAVVDRHADGRARESDVVPISLHAIVRERVEECSEDERAFIRAASLCGRRFDLDVIERVVGVGGDRSAQLRRLCGLQLIVPIDGRPREYAFRHAMTRDALYGELLPSEAQPLHEKIALALLESPNAAAYVTEIAHHYWQSVRRAAGAEYYEAAARHARRTLAYAEAIRWYERAIDTCGYDRSDVARVRLELARTLAAADQPVEALQMYGDIVQRALECGDLDVFVRARKLMGGLLANDGRREEAISLLEATLESIHDMALSSKLDHVRGIEPVGSRGDRASDRYPREAERRLRLRCRRDRSALRRILPARGRVRAARDVRSLDGRARAARSRPHRLHERRCERQSRAVRRAQPRDSKRLLSCKAVSVRRVAPSSLKAKSTWTFVTRSKTTRSLAGSS